MSEKSPELLTVELLLRIDASMERLAKSMELIAKKMDQPSPSNCIEFLWAAHEKVKRTIPIQGKHYPLTS